MTLTIMDLVLLLIAALIVVGVYLRRLSFRDAIVLLLATVIVFMALPFVLARLA